MLFASRRNGRSPRHSAILAAAVTGLGLAASAHAATITWQNTGTDFNDPASWGVGTINAGDDALFSNAVVSQPQLSANITLAQVRFASTASGYNITAASGQALSLTSTGTNSTNGTGAALVGLHTTGTNTITADIVLARTGVGSQTFNQASGGTLDILGNISSTLGSTSLSINGAGTVRLLGTNTFGGGLSTSSTGIVAIGNNALGSGTLSIANSGGIFRSSDDSHRVINNQLRLSASSGNFSFAGAAGGSGNIIFTNNTTLTGNVVFSSWTGSAVAFEGIIADDDVLTPRSFSVSGKTNSDGNGYVFLMNTANTFSGQASVGLQGASGITVVSSLKDIGSGGDSLGNQPDATVGKILVARGSGTATQSHLRYVGATTSTNRAIEVSGTATTVGFTLDASGYGALTLTSNLTMTGTSGGATRSVGLTGINIDENTFVGSIPDGVSTTAFTKSGTGTWVLKGSNTFTKGISITGGKLVLDYTTNSSIVSSANTLSLTGGTLALKAAASGSTAQTIGAVTLATSGSSQLLLAPNGGSGITLTTGAWTRSGGSTLYVDLPTGATLTAAPALTFSIIPYAVVRDSLGTGYGTVVSGNVVRYTSGTAMTLGTETGTNTNFNITGGLTLGGSSRQVGSLAIDTTGGGTLDLNNLTITLGNQRSVLFTGTSDYMVSNGILTGAANEVLIHQYSSGVVTLSGTTGTSTGTITKSGPGTLVIASNGDTGVLRVTDGAVRANAAVIASGAISLTTGGVLELSDSNFSGNIGSSAGNVQIVGDGGFSAFGATRTVQLNGSTASIAWASTNFVPTNNALVLSGKDSDALIDFQNGLGFGNQQRVVQVNNGSAAVDARLSGVLSGAYGGGLVKRGAGTLELTNTNTYLGETWVQAGSLLVNNTTGSGTGTGKVTVFSGATLGGTGTIGGLVNVKSGGTLAPGNSPGIQNYNAGLTFDSGANYNWEHNAGNALGTAGTNYDVANITGGTLTVTAGANLDLLFASGTAFNDSFWDSNQSWNIVTGGASGSNFFGTSNIFVNVNGSPVDGGDNVIAGEGSFATSVSGNNVVLTWTALVGGTAKYKIEPNTPVTLNTLRGAASISSTLTVTETAGFNGSTVLSGLSGLLSLSATNLNINALSTGTSNAILSTGTYGSGTQIVDLTNDDPADSVTINYNVGNAATGTGSTFGTALTGASTGTGNALSSITSDTEARVLQITNGLNVTMDWREAGADVAPIVGDVVRVITTDNAYVLILSYADNPGTENSYFLGTRIPSSNFWTGAGNMITYLNQGTYAGQTTLGMWGNDISNNYVWAIIDGTVGGATNEFAVIPEPASLMLLGLGAVGLLARRRR